MGPVAYKGGGRTIDQSAPWTAPQVPGTCCQSGALQPRKGTGYHGKQSGTRDQVGRQLMGTSQV